MTKTFFARRARVAIACTIFVATTTSFAGTIGTRWDAVAGGDVVGYRVYFGPASGNYDQSTDVGLTTETTLLGVPDCAVSFVAVKARNAAGDVSANFSNEVSGWPRPEIASTDRPQLVAGGSYSIAIDGTNFRPGSTLTLSSASLSVSALSVENCNRVSFDVDVAAGAAPGSVDAAIVHPDGVFGAAVGLFEILPDQSGPSISGLTVDTLGATTATVTWQTDEVADGSLSLRRAGDPEYQSFVDTGVDGTDHSVSLTGLSPDTQYFFFVTSDDGQGNSSDSAVSGFTTTASPYAYLPIEAEWASMSVPLVIVGNTDAFSGEAVALPTGSGVGTPSNPVGEGSIVVEVPSSGTWKLWLRVLAPNASARRWLFAVDGGGYEALSAPTVGEWSWIAASDVTLAAGEHTIDFGGADPEARLDRVWLTDDPNFAPTLGPGGDTTSPSAVSALAALAGDGSVDLSWVHPSNNDLDRVVVRSRTDGRFPAHPYDGTSVYDAAATAGGPGALQDGGLQNGTEVRYAIFTIDRSGNASVAATIAATPQTTASLPADVQNLERTDVIE